MSEPTTTPRMGLRVEILRSKYANVARKTNGLPFDELTLVGPDVDQVFPVTEDAPAVEIYPHRAGPQERSSQWR